MAALGRPGYINLDRNAILGEERPIDVMQSQANNVMDQLFALSSPNNTPWIDCARSYGLSEKFVGEYLRKNKIGPDDVYVSSKWGYTYVADWNIQLGQGEPHEVKDHSAENFLKQVEETNKLLGEYVKLYQVHSATFESGILSDPLVHEALGNCRKERGWSIGLSVSGPNQSDVLREAMKLKTKDGENRLFDSVQCTYNVFEQRAGEALQEAHTAGMDIIIKEGLANGRALRSPVVKKYAERVQCEPDQLALGCILAQPFEARVLSGAITPEQLKSNFAAQKVAEKLKGDPELLLEIMASCRVKSEDYWRERSALAWN
jgi:aryl-alcohol dehydrogenase-like predicted oxidoreductase